MSRWTPVLKDVIEDCIDEKLDNNHFPFLGGQRHGSQFSSGAPSRYSITFQVHNSAIEHYFKKKATTLKKSRLQFIGGRKVEYRVQRCLRVLKSFSINTADAASFHVKDTLMDPYKDTHTYLLITKCIVCRIEKKSFVYSSGRYGGWHKDKVAVTNQKNVPRIICFILGGATFSEFRVGYEVSNDKKNWEVIVGKLIF